MSDKNPKTFKKLTISGFVLIAFELLILIFSAKRSTISGEFLDENWAFFINYFAAVTYFIFILFSNKPFFTFKTINRRLFFISLVLFSISAFTLNHSMRMFAPFTIWTIIYLLVFFWGFIGFSYKDKLSRPLRIAIYFILGAGSVLLLYFSIYLSPFYHFGILGLFLLGISGLLFVPLTLLVTTIITFINVKSSQLEKIFFWAGVFIPLVVLSVFIIQWNGLKKDIHKASSSIITRPDNTLPTWVLLCQDIASDDFTKKIIKGNLAYDTFQSFWRNGFTGGSFDEVKKHDPLVNIGIALLGDINLDNSTRIKILKSQHNARHLAQRKLWSGRNIRTVEVLSNIKIYPDYRFAYTEKIISVKNMNHWQNSQQEAAFTFYLPEGSVATSLSLWINGKEEPSRLTTKSKADSAYVTIVGVESRDPALLHWQEGNTLTVTIFPCTPSENRQFKIGITTPLLCEQNTLTLSNIYFEGPELYNALETTVLEAVSEENPEIVDIPKGFKKNIEGKFIYTGKYKPYWETQITKTTLSNRSFSFNNKGYYMKELNKSQHPFNPSTIFLDLNKSWSRSEFEEVWKNIKAKTVYVYLDKMTQVTESNKDEVYKTFSKKNFSLFPFHDIQENENSLVISKSTELSPNLSDIEDSEFAIDLGDSFSDNKDFINFFQIGNLSSPYIKSMKELGLLNFSKGSIDNLCYFLDNKTFILPNTDKTQVDIELANISIIQDTTSKNEGAPDHLMRLFSYNQIMKEMGRDYFDLKNMEPDRLIAIANEAYVVSPVSSLVVLESKKDYDRFGIDKNKNSLKNASMNSAGAVPEPSEWVLIGLLVLILGFLVVQRKRIGVRG